MIVFIFKKFYCFYLTCHRSRSLRRRSPERSPSTPPCSLLTSSLTSRRERRTPAAAGPRSPSSWRCCFRSKRSATRFGLWFEVGKWGWLLGCCRWWAGAFRRRSCGVWSFEEEECPGPARCSASARIEIWNLFPFDVKCLK